ncbi:MAG: RHS repeat-associated core domain-containing protein [Acidobacteriota bacterium]
MPDGTPEYEVKATLHLAGSGGTYVAYTRASADALAGPAASGTYYSIEVQNPTFSGTACTATYAIYRRMGGAVSLLASTAGPCRDGMVLRVVQKNSNLVVLADDVGYLQILDNSIPTGVPGIGAYGTPAGSSIARIAFGAIDRLPPTAVDAQSVAVSALPNSVALQWKGVPDDVAGIGTFMYHIWRNGVVVADCLTPEWNDAAVDPATTYTYAISAWDSHFNFGPATSFTVTTPPPTSADPRRVGVRTDGAYWGGAGEQIDVRSGNLNYTIPIIKAIARGGWTVGFSLSYNSQVWRQDSGATWKLGRDVGYGYGWRLQAGSITPYWSDWCTIHHYVFIDSTGAEYRLDVNTNGIWTSRESGVYVEYDAAAKRLYFPDGTFWYMGAVSAGSEQDAGTRYPTILQDTNGNQIVVRYDQGLSTAWPDSSARITTIQDVRALLGVYGHPQPYRTFTLVYSAAEPVPHLSQIKNDLMYYDVTAFTHSPQPLSSPFVPEASFGTATTLQQIARAGLSHTFEYAGGAGELSRVTLPQGGALRWEYRTFTYSGAMRLREVANRYLSKTPGAAETAYNIYHDDDASFSLHAWTVLGDPTGAAKVWFFQTDGAVATFQDRASLWANVVRQRDLAYAQDASGRNYIASVITTLDSGLQSKTEQTVDAHGNVTQTKLYAYGNLTTPVRTYSNTYLASSDYTTRHIWNRVVSSAVTDGANNVTLATNTYDGGTLTNVSPIAVHDPASDTSFRYRGNITKSVTPGATRNMTYDIGGNVVNADDGYGHVLVKTFSNATAYTVPDKISPNNDNFATALTYSAFLNVASVAAPGSTSSVEYDNYARPKQSTSPYGAITNYTYPSSNVITATTETRIVTTTLDGLGRTVKVETGDSSAVQSVVETEYDSCACSPLGKLKRVSRPYKPGDPVYWTTYTYDALGRTTRIDLPGGTGAITYAYAGNTATVSDPAGKWKKYTTDAMGNLIQVTEPAPEGGTHETYYTYNVLNQMTQVWMPRATGTQTRTFNYDLATGRLMSATNPENGTVQYAYNADGTLLRKTDAKNQKIEFGYDTYGRVRQKRVYRSGSPTEDACGHVDYSYDTNAWNTNWLTAPGRLVAVRYGGLSCTGGRFTESFGYSAGNLMGSRSIKLERTINGLTRSSEQSVGFGYTATGEFSGLYFRQIWRQVLPNNTDSYNFEQVFGPSFVYTMDSLGRPIKLNDGNMDRVKDVTYGPAGELLTLTYPAGSNWGVDDWVYTWYKEARTYNVRGQVSRIQATGQYAYANTPPSMDLEYRYSPTANDGRITQMLNRMTGEEVNYQYDSLGRLSLAETTGVEWGQSFGYDGFGNLLSEQATKGTAYTTNLNVDPATNRIVGGGHTYDANGNLTAMPALTMSYDVENRLVQAVHTQNGTQKYVYNPWNQRVWSSTGSSEGVMMYGPNGERLVWLPVVVSPGGAKLVLLFVYAGVDAKVRPILHFRGRKIWSGGGVKEDRLGTWVDGGSTPYPVYPYGEQRSQYYVVYATYPRETNGLDYAMNRWYSSQVARFTSPDPYQASGGAADPQSWNRYSYVQNDPVNFVDPEGLRRRDGDGVWLNGGILIGGFGSGLSVEGGLGGPPPPAVVIGAGPVGGGGGGKGTTAVQRFAALPSDCQKGLTAALSVASGTSAEVAAQFRLGALDRASAASITLSGSGAGWAMVAAIGIRETGFRNIKQLNGQGVGVFQIDLGQHPEVTAKQAHDLTWSAKWVLLVYECACVGGEVS